MEQHAYSQPPLADLDEQILALLEDGLPICQRPYLEIAKSISLGEMALLLRLQKLNKEQRSLRLVSCPPLDSFESFNPPRGRSGETILSHWDSELITLINYGLPLSSRPFHILAKILGLTVDEAIFRIERLQSWGAIGKIRPIR